MTTKKSRLKRRITTAQTYKYAGDHRETEARQRAREEFRQLGAVLGLFQLDQWDYGTVSASGQYKLKEEEIDAKVAERNAARRQKDFKKADEIRQILAADGVILEDKPDGTSRWKR